MERIKSIKSSKQLIFILMAVVMFVITLVLIIYFITSLSESIDSTLKLPPQASQNVQFDIQGFKNLHLTQ